MTENKSKRVALSWNQEFKSRLVDLEGYIKKINGGLTPTNLELFMFCLGYGFQNNAKSVLPPKISDAVRIEYIKEEINFMRIVALASCSDESVLIDNEKIYDEVEKFAGGGLALLVYQMDNNHDFLGYILTNLYSNIDILEEKSKLINLQNQYYQESKINQSNLNEENHI